MILARMIEIFGAGFRGLPVRPEPPARRPRPKKKA
jgi:hypothetical protein